MNSFKICGQFGIEAVAKKDIVKGLINNTCLITAKNGKRYILQEINANIFKNVEELMNNIERVTDHIRRKTTMERSETTTLNLVKANGKNYTTIVDEDGKPHYYRMYEYIDNASSFDQANEELLYQAGVGFGDFQRQLADFPAEQLYETIPDFHNTKARFQQFLDAYDFAAQQGDPMSIFKSKKEIQYALDNQQYAGIIVDALESKQIPYRVVHNDTKLNNVMLDNQTHQPVCVIDLDTIMPGSLLYDYGDAIRYGANASVEDDRNLSNVKIDMAKFRAFTDGFLKKTAGSITTNELNLMAQAPIVLTYELGLRFLADYLNGNQYFRCDSSRPDHNLERARAQFTLMQDMINHLPEMQQIINELYHKNRTLYDPTSILL